MTHEAFPEPPYTTGSLMLATVAAMLLAFAIVIGLNSLPLPGSPTRDSCDEIVATAERNAQRIKRLEGDVEILKARFERLDSVITFANRREVAPRYAAIVLDAAWATGLDPGLAFELVRVESGFDSTAISRAGAIGLTQIMPRTAKSECPRANLFNPRDNARCGFSYLLKLIERYEGNVDSALRHYNGGGRAVGNDRHVSRHYAEAVCGGDCEEVY